MAAPDRLGDDLRYRFRVFPGPDKVGGDPPRRCHGEAARAGPLVVTDRAHVNPDVRAAGLMTVRHRELVLVSRKMAQPVQCLPRTGARRLLVPAARSQAGVSGRAEAKRARRSRWSGTGVPASWYTPRPPAPVLRQDPRGAPRLSTRPRVHELAARNQPPLILGQLPEKR